MRIDQYISDLLYTNDCVIIPGFGGFVANTRNSFLNPSQHTFSPPLKRIAFNASLKVNDGLLTHHISRVNNISYLEAINLIQRYVDDCFLKLNAGLKVEIQNVGTVSFDLEQHLQFEPDNTVNYLLESFGLAIIHSPAIRREEKQIPLRKIKKREKTIQPTSRKWRLFELVPAAAILAILVFNPKVIQTLNTSLGSIVPVLNTNPIKVEDKKTQTAVTFAQQVPQQPIVIDSAKIQADLILNQQQIDATAKAMELAFNKAVDEETEAILANDKSSNDDLGKTIAEPISTATATVVTPSQTNTSNYNIIGGCFSIEENATKYMNEAIAKGYNATVIGKNNKGLWMVSLFTGSNLLESQQKLNSIKSDFQSSAWMYKN